MMSSLWSYLPSGESVYRSTAVLVLLLFLAYLQQRQSRIQRAASLKIQAANKFQKRNEKRQAMHKKMHEEFTVPDEARREFLLSLSASALHSHLHVTHDVTCEEVVLLYSLRALAVGSLTNAVTEEFYDEALTQAKAVDERIAARRRGDDTSTPGVLEGIPMSVKDVFHQRGADTTCGFAARCFQPYKEDGLIVQMLRDAGAILFVRSAVPQALMAPESMSAVWGVAANPWALDRTPGGSSGGEGALLAARASVLGIGSDIGGSLRIPSHFCGVYSLKPTPARLTLDGLAAPCLGGISGQIAVRAVAGPMAHSVDDLTLTMRAWLREDMWSSDPTVPRLPLDEAALANKPVADGGEKLRIGYYEHDGWFEAAPACARAVRQAVAALEEAGHECVRWTPPAVPSAVRIYYCLMSADGAEAILSGLEGEELHESYSSMALMLRLPRVIRRLLVGIMRLPQVGQMRAALLMKSVCPLSAVELYDIQAAHQQYVSTFTAAWKSEGFDAVLCPGVGLPALEHGGSADLATACSYTFLWNLLHYPVGSVPIGRTESHELVYESSHADLFTSKSVSTVAGSLGLPVGVQVAALPFQDEMVLRVMKEIERTVHFTDKPDMATQIKI